MLLNIPKARLFVSKDNKERLRSNASENTYYNITSNLQDV